LVEPAAARRTIICAKCRHRFTPAGAAEQVRTSGKAMASLVLGLGAMFAFFLTGIPAIVLGVLALREIQRSGGKTTGRSQAITGIVAGVLFGVLCSPFVGAVTLGVLRQLRNPPREFTDSAQITRLAYTLPEHRPPEGLAPIYGFEHLLGGMRQVVYADRPQGAATLAFISQAPAAAAFNRGAVTQQMQRWETERQLNIAVQESRKLSWTVLGQPAEVTRETGTSPATGVPRRRYVAFVQDGERLLTIMVSTQDRPTVDDGVAPSEGQSLSEEQVREFFESLGTRK
jgi:hypothetical protein